MSDYFTLKNAALIAPTTTQDLGSETNRYGNVFLSGNISLDSTTITSTNVITPKVTSIGYIGDDTAADIAGGQTITLNGTGFASGASVLIAGTVVSIVSFVSSTQMTFVSPAQAAGSYVLYVVNTDGGTAISIPGIQYSGVPTWTTGAGSLGSANTGTAVNITLAATGDAPVTYSVFSGTLPPGVTLNSSTGVLSGTTPSVGVETTYNFVIKANDLQSQDTNRSFSFTVTVYVGKLYSWGSSFYGGLGLGDTVPRSSPVQVGSLTDWASLSSGGNGGATSILGAKTDGTLWSWGRNANGTLGLGDTINRSSPVQVGTLTDWSVSSSSQSINTTVVVKTNGSLWTWGGAAPGGNGTLGLGDTIRRSSPTQVGLMTTWLSVSAGLYHTVATKTDGTMWTWGWGPRGSLGQNNTLSYNSPVQVGALTNWLLARTGQYTVVAIKTNGTLWSWGKNENGQLGLGDSTVYRSSPIQVGSLTNWKTISVDSGGQTHVLAIKTNGTLWAWGNNSYGTLGDGTTLNRSSPVQIGSLTTWESISASDSESYAIKTDGTLWTWGRNYSGALGLGDTFRRSSPVQVGLLNTWIKLSIDGVSAAISG
jgi:alpha-tubulin suppressor-like RCC1 family protein